MRRPHLLLAAAALIAGASACSDPNQLSPAVIDNFVDTLTLGAVTGTPLDLPSGFSVTKPHAVRTDGDDLFDFIFQVDTVGGVPVARFYPTNALGLRLPSPQPGIAPLDVAFDSLAEAPSNGYVTDSAVTAVVGRTYAVRSRNTTEVCNIGVPQYAKIQVLSIDDRRITLRALSDNNCGYRGLEPGLPER